MFASYICIATVVVLLPGKASIFRATGKSFLVVWAKFSLYKKKNVFTSMKAVSNQIFEW